MDIINGRYLIERPFDIDSESRSFVVYDKKTGEKKLLRLFNKGLNIDSHNPLIENFFSFSKIKHENILLDYNFDLIKEFSSTKEMQYFYTKEFIDDKIIKYTDLNYKDRLFVLEKILYALSYFHFKGFVYGKLSFPNILIYRDENKNLKVKLNDMASIVFNRTLKFPSKNDSIFYVSGMESVKLSTKSDIFSLGMITYYLLTGSDYERENVDYEGLKSMDARISNLISRSINMDISKRPKSIMEFWNEASDILGISNEFFDRKYYEDLDFSSPFVVHKEKRDSLLDKISSYFEDGSGKNVMFVRSKTGMGKSRFLSEIKYFSKIRNINSLLLDVRDDLDGEYPNFGYIVRQILTVYNPTSSFIEKYGADLLHLVPEYSEEWGMKASSIDDEMVLKNRITSRFLSLVSFLSSNISSVIIIDNVDKLSSKELELLVALITSPIKNAPYLVLSARNMPQEIQDWCSGDEYFSLELGAFNHHETVFYVDNLLNIGDESKEIAREINAICHGNPRKIEKTILYMIENDRIRITDNRTWLVKNLLLTHTREEILSLPIDEFNQKLINLPQDSITILNHIAVFNQEVDVFFAINFIGLGGKRFKDALEPLISSNILQKSVTDWGNYYEFKDYRLLNAFYDSININTKIEIHKKITSFYEDDTTNHNKIEFDSYIYHLTKSNQVEKAIQALKENAITKCKDLKWNEAIEYFEYALSISETNSMEGYRLSIIQDIADLQYKIGKLEKAEKSYKELIEMGDKFNLPKLKFSSMEKLIEIFIFQSRIIEAQRIIKDINNKFFDEIDDDFKMRIKFLSIKLKLKLRKNDDFSYFEKDFDELEKISNRYYKSIMLLQKAYFDVVNSKYIDARTKIENSISILNNEGTKTDLIFAYRLLANISIKHDNDFSAAEKYLKEAYNIAEEFNVLWKNTFLLIDIAHLKKMQYDFLSSEEYYKMAEQYASLSSQVDALMLSAISISRLKLYLKDYDECKIQIDKYKIFFELNKDSALSVYYYSYLLVKSELLLELRELDRVRELINEIEDNGISHLTSLKKMEFSLHKIKFEYMNYLLFETEFKYQEIATLIMVADSIEERILIKNYLLDFAIDTFLNDEGLLFDYIYEQIDSVINNKENKKLLFKYEICEALLDNDVEKITHYADDINLLDDSFRWKLYCILADIYYKENDYVNSLANYIEARGQIFDELDNFPIEYRLQRLETGRSYSKIENRIVIIQKELYGVDLFSIDKKKQNLFTQDKLIAKLSKDKDFKNYSSSLYKNIFSISIPSWQDYILTLDEENKVNIQKTIKFLTQFTLSQYGCLVLLDDNKDVIETFSTNSDYDPVVIDYISDMRTGMKYYIENKDWNFSLDIYSRMESTKLFFPIYLKEKENTYSRRLKDRGKNENKLMAYVYLESNKVINNINFKTYSEIKKYEPLLALVINDYKMTQKATVDKLTGIHIRSYVQDRVEQLFEKGNLFDLNFSVIMLDIDHFKDVNDTYGHTRGDEVLQDVAEILKNSIRKSDILGRYGGEEFVIVLNDVKKEIVLSVADKIRQAIEKAKLLGEDRALTISVGAACYPQDGKTFDSLIENADKALYKSKNNGRNMVSVYDTNICKEDNSYDNLAGVLGISASEDSRRMNAIFEINNTISKYMSTEDRIEEILSRILDIVEANGISIVLKSGKIFSKSKNDDNLYLKSLLDKKIIDEMLKREDGFFVDWKDETYTKGEGKTLNWSTYISSTMTFMGKDYGKIIVFSNINEHEFERHHYKFVSSVSSIIASVVKHI